MADCDPLETNILVYARREETPHHARAKKILKELAAGGQPWALPWPFACEIRLT
jgi:predicted nucleic acid-binding protein